VSSAENAEDGETFVVRVWFCGGVQCNGPLRRGEEGEGVGMRGREGAAMAPGGVMDRLPLTLFMERGPGEGKSFPTTRLKRVTIGRTRTNNYPIKDPTVSQKHAVIEWRVDCWMLTDLGSSNGTDVNGKVLVENEPVRLRNGDLIRFGEAIKVRVQIEEEEEEEDEEEEEAAEEELEREQERQEEEDEEPGITVEEWFEQERQRIVQAVHAKADATILEMKQSAEQLKRMFREHAGVE
jgi:pSer/pThr/pTyr-binding forkhead associated (FHA) protein